MTLLLYIDGKSVASHSGGTRDSLNPATQEVVAKFSWADGRDAQDAIAAAKVAFQAGPWRQYSGKDRRALIERLAACLMEKAEDFTLHEVQDAGALIAKAKTDVMLAVGALKQFARMSERYDGAPMPVEGLQREGRSFTYMVREPIGVCGAIIPWNFPLNMAIWKIGQALATGNTLVLKCAPETPVSALSLGPLLTEAGVPPGVVNIITGDVEVGEALTQSPDVGKVSFTGSTDVGRAVMAAASATMKRVTLECGGKSANIVLDDADRDMAVDGSIYASFFHAGQVCESGTRLLVSRQSEAAFTDALLARVGTLKMGDPMDPDTTLGPVISARQRDRVMGYIEKGISEGADLRTGGHLGRGGSLDQGFFVEPTVFSGVNNTMTIAREEIFGPVLSILTFTDTEDAVRIANDSIYGLAAGVWSKDDEKAMQIAGQLQAGFVWLNEWHVLNPGAPFGGFKQSGIGREFGEDGMNEWTEIKTIYRDDVRQRKAKTWYDVVIPN